MENTLQYARRARGKNKRWPVARSILGLLIHLIPLGSVSASLARGAAGWI